MSPSKNFIVKEVSTLPESEMLITGEIALPFLVSVRVEALRSLQNSISLPGFRQGKIPEDVLVKKLGEMRILEESAEIALSREYSNIIKEAKIRALGRPEISIVKLAPLIPLEFKIKVAIEPEFELADYKKIAPVIFGEKAPTLTVTDKEVEDVLEEMKKRGIKPDFKEGENLDEKLKENLLLEKKERFKESQRLKFLGQVIEKTEIIAPKVLIEFEMNKMLGQFRGDVERMGIKWDEYLQKLNKTEEALREEWRVQAVSRVKAELIINKIASIEKIEPKEEEVKHEVTHLLSHYPEADPTSAISYVYTQLRNRAVFEFLEGSD